MFFIIRTTMVAILGASAVALAQTSIPGDIQWTSLMWSFENRGQPFQAKWRQGTHGKIGADAQILEAWKIVDRSPDILIAVIDAGFDLNHPDLRGIFVEDLARNFVDPGTPIPIEGQHGTIVSGVIGANGFNQIGISGVSRFARIIPIHAIGINKQGKKVGQDKILAAFRYAVSIGARIINCSFGTIDDDPRLKLALEYARANNVLVVVSAGNLRNDNDRNPLWPANYSPAFENVISVAASDRTDNLWIFKPNVSIGSNWGAQSVDVAAPGDEVVSTLSSQPGYFISSGTSESAPFVAGIAALMLQINPTLSARQLKDVLLSTADPVDGLKGKVRTGARVNALRAVMAARDFVP